MGTNYFVKSRKPCNTCEHCGSLFAVHEELHIGKSSAGWCFGLHVIPEKGLNTLNDWVDYIVDHDNTHMIVNEYGETLDLETLLGIITCRHSFSKRDDKWYEQNHAVLGINGLARHKVGEGGCIGHCDGTYDYVVGNFS